MRITGILVLALVVRLAYLGAIVDEARFSVPYAGMDVALYDGLAQRIAAGDLALGDRVFHHSALFTYLLGAEYAVFGAGPWPARVTNLLLGLATVLLVHRIARALHDDPLVADIAALGAALYGPYVVFDTSAMKTTTGLFLVALALWAALRARRWGWLGTGAALGAAYNLHGAIGLFAVSVITLLLWRRAWRDAALVGAGLLLAVSPVLVRNGVVAGEWTAGRTGGGLHFRAANQARAWGGYRRIEGVRPNPRGHDHDGRRVAERARGRTLTAGEVDAYHREQAMTWIKAHPGDFARLVGRRFLLTCNAYEIPNNENYRFLASRSGFLRVLPGAFALFPLFFVGLFRRKLRPVAALFLITQTGALLFGLVTWRYRLPLTLVAWPLAAVALLEIVGALRARTWRKLGLLVAGLAAAVVLTRLPYPSDELRDGQAKQAHVKWMASEAERDLRRRLDRAVSPLERRVVRLELAHLRERMKDLEGAIAILAESLARDGAHAPTDLRLASLREELE